MSEIEAPPSRARAGCALVLGVNAALGLLVLAAFWFIGNSLDQTRSGIQLVDGELRVISAVCPEERLEAVRLFRVASEEGAAQEILWEMEGDTDFPAEFAVGAALPGTLTEVPFFDDLGPDDELVFRLRSSTLQAVDAFGFTLADLEDGRVVSVPELSAASAGAFRDRATELTPCE